MAVLKTVGVTPWSQVEPSADAPPTSWLCLPGMLVGEDESRRQWGICWSDLRAGSDRPLHERKCTGRVAGAALPRTPTHVSPCRGRILISESNIPDKRAER